MLLRTCDWRAPERRHIETAKLGWDDVSGGTRKVARSLLPVVQGAWRCPMWRGAQSSAPFFCADSGREAGGSAGLQRGGRKA